MHWLLDLMLVLLVAMPLLSGVVLVLLPDLTKSMVRVFSLLATLATFVLSLIGACFFDWSNPAALSFVKSVEWVGAFGLQFGFGVNAISMWLVLLTTFLMPLVVLGSFSAIQDRVKEFFLWLLILESAMLGVFVATDIVFFHICFEFTLIPLYFLIGIYGSAQRLKAARVFFLYTFTGSMLTFAGLLYVAWRCDWVFSIATLYELAPQRLSEIEQAWVMGAMLAGFAVKVPLFPLHTWLPLAHTEAPTAGSVILAGVLLKLGTYALLQLAIPIAPIAADQFAPIIGLLAVVGILYAALICWVQKDIKKLIAYSSVSHLGFCVLGMFAFNTEGMAGSVMYMINHGLSTGALFLCVVMIYERFHTRQMSQMQGLAQIMPVWSFFMVFFCLASVGLPGLNGFVGEFLTLLGAFRAKYVLGPPYAVMAGFGLIFAAIYILFMVGKVVFGPLKVPRVENGHCLSRDLNLREIVTLPPLAAGCLWLGLQPSFILDTLTEPLEKIVEHLPQRTAVAHYTGDYPRIEVRMHMPMAQATKYAGL